MIIPYFLAAIFNDVDTINQVFKAVQLCDRKVVIGMSHIDCDLLKMLRASYIS